MVSIEISIDHAARRVVLMEGGAYTPTIDFGTNGFYVEGRQLPSMDRASQILIEKFLFGSLEFFARRAASGQD